MKARYRLTPKADRDLAQIWCRTNENWGKSQANKYLQLLEKGFLMLPPEVGKARDEIRRGYRSRRLKITWYFIELGIKILKL